MELIVGLVVMAVVFAAVILGFWFGIRAIIRMRRRPVPEPTGPRVGTAALRMQLEALRDRGFVLEDDGGEKIILRLPLLEAGSRGGKVSEEYRTVVKLDEESGTARLSERRISKERGFGGVGLFRFSAWTAPTAGARDRRESGSAGAPGAAGGSFRLDAVAARALIEQTIAAAGWRMVT